MKKFSVFIISIVSDSFRVLGLRACRFHPTCSCYAKEAFEKTSFFKAAFLTVKRLSRCHPFSAAGFDPLIIKE